MKALKTQHFFYRAANCAGYIFLPCITLEVCGLIFDHCILRDIFIGSGMLKPKVIRKPHPRPILAFINAVRPIRKFLLSPRQKGQRIRGHKGPAKCIGSSGAQTRNIFYSILL